jgi:hypothetical protein
MTAVEDVTLNRVFQGQEDRFHGITVDSSKEPCDVSAFPKKLEGTVPCRYIITVLMSRISYTELVSISQ